jgi:hypothetical protein
VQLRGHRPTNHNRQNRVIFADEGGVAAAKGICGSQLFKLCESSKVPFYAAHLCSVMLTRNAW